MSQINEQILGNGLNILAVGAQSRGKSDFIKNMLQTNRYKARPLYAFDPNTEYKNNYARNLATRPDFLAYVPHKKNSSVNVVFEEASGFFSKAGTIPMPLVAHICRKDHTDNLNIFSYHSLSTFNKDNLIYIDYIHLYRTKETVKDIEKAFDGWDNIIAGFIDVKQKTENTFFNRRMRTYGNGTKENEIHSRNFFHYKQIIQIN